MWFNWLKRYFYTFTSCDICRQLFVFLPIICHSVPFRLCYIVITYLLTYSLHHGIWLVARSALFEQNRGWSYCLQSGHALFNFATHCHIKEGYDQFFYMLHCFIFQFNFLYQQEIQDLNTWPTIKVLIQEIYKASEL